MSLYTLYRPRDWDSVIGQDRIKTILRNALTHDRVGHAYLFHGSRGTGKTSSARILAKGVNCTHINNGNPCHTCTNCLAFDNGTMLDVIEIDAASNTGVDNIRDLIEKARFEPNQGKYKVYIIDEVHMLSTGAFNALLKTLEEPPTHVKFILATTEVDKVPETIRSRALRFDFRKITESDIIDRLKFVIHEEKIQAEEAAIKIIAKYARGGLRDALTLLEQNTIDSELSLEHVRMTLSLLEESRIDHIIESLKISDIATIMSTISSLRDIHVSARGFFEQVMYRLRDLMIAHLDDGLYHTYQELYEYFESAYTRVRAIPDGMLLIEMTLLKIVKRGGRKEEIGDREVNTREQSKVESEKKELKKDDNSKMGVRTGWTVGTKTTADKKDKQSEEEGVGLPSETFGTEGEFEGNEKRSSPGGFGHKSTENGVGEKNTGFLPSQEGQGQSGQILPSSQTLPSSEGQGQPGHGSWATTPPGGRQKQPEQDVSSSSQTQTTLSTGQESILPSYHPTTPSFSYIVLLEVLKSTKPALVIDLKTARFELDGTKLILIFPKNWNYTRVNTNEMKNIITESLCEKFGGGWSVECRLDESKIQASLVDDVF